ncbi:hypothetical protein N8I77_013340 [Diaporthe amygdali]|uniref:Uncharacterized protein n=1 Tax=Phomopsis amygdali TaxID=1214568 RepID=A0AAD9VY60_PHOAM|nr:hypothetical protein N8I77_013340 [Diaporthe amygdali]
MPTPYQRENIVERGESFVTRASLIMCVHGHLRDGNDYATFLAIEFMFLPRRKSRRARMANINLRFTDEGTAPGLEVVDVNPKGVYNIRHNQSSEVPSIFPRQSGNAVGLAEVGGAQVDTTRETGTDSMVRISGNSVSFGNYGTKNEAQWTIQEAGSNKAGIPESFIGAVLLRRTGKQPFSMMPTIQVKVSGLAFEQAFAGGLRDDPVIFDPKMASTGLGRGPFHLTDTDRSNLEGFWNRQFANKPIGNIQFVVPHTVSPSSDPASNHCVPASDGKWIQSNDPEAHISISGVGSRGIQPQFDEDVLGAVYTELWNIDATEAGAMRPLIYRWQDLGNPLDDDKLSKHVSWLKEESELRGFSDMQHEQQYLETNVTQDTEAEAHRRHMEIPETTHTLCSVLIRKAKKQTSFKSVQDLSQELFDTKTMKSILEIFDIEYKDYNGYRKLDFGSCELRSTGKGRELSTFYIIQTPYYRRGFWSMFLVGKADPKDPNRARKLSGLIQSGSDVELREIVDATASKAERYNYHPLLLPYRLYVNHYENTSKQFNSVLKDVELVERLIKDELDNRRRLTSQAGGKVDDYEDSKPSHWGLAKWSKTLHEASMEVAELARRRTFEDYLGKTLIDELNKETPPHYQLSQDVGRHDRWAKAHQLDIEGMPGRIDSLNNLLYSMIAQQDNIMSIKLATEGLSDSKAMKTLSIITILFLPGTFVATIFTTNVVSFQDSAAETKAYIAVVVPLTVVLMTLYGLWPWIKLAWSTARQKMRDPETGNMGMFSKSPNAASKTAKQM